ncbi:MAG: hypothetical protein EOP07_23595, partial [Proteobacteria bacterium]
MILFTPIDFLKIMFIFAMIALPSGMGLFGKTKRDTQLNPSVSAWPAVLEVLNQNPSIPYSDISSDEKSNILADYKNEMSTISNLWASQADSKKDPRSMESKRLANAFFHEEISKLNAKTFVAFNPSLSLAKDFNSLAKSVLKNVQNNPVAKLEASQNYDPSGQLGFCFGRALLVHYELLKAGVKQQDIAKIFVAGQLRVAHQIWNFHVAVMVRDAKHGFIVIDPLYDEPMSLKAWSELVASYDMKGTLSRARFYSSDPRRFLPSGERYGMEQFENKYLKKYF